MRRTNAIRLNWLACARAALVPASTLLLLSLAATLAASAQVPSVTFSATSGLTGIGSSAGAGDFGGTAGHSAANARGDVFLDVGTSSSQYVVEIPANGGAQVALLTDTNAAAYGGRAVFADSGGNLYATVVDGTTFGADIVYIPFVNGSYPTGAVYSSLSACSSFPVPATTTATCKVPLNYPGSLGYYVQAADVALDGSGNLYILAKYVGGSPATQYNQIIEWPAATNSALIRAGTLPNNTGNPEFAVDAAGDVFYADGSGNNYYLAAGGSTLISLPEYYIDGVSIDAGQNVYFTQGNGNNYSIIEFPFIGGTACHGSDCTGDQYIVSTQLSSGYTSGPSLGVIVDGRGKIYYAGSYPNSLSALTVASLTFGSTPTGTTSGTATLNLTFGNNNSYPTFGSFSLTGPFAVSSTTCTAGTTYGPYATANCAVTLTYSASAPGPQTGSVQAYDSSGNLIGEAALSGTGAGANLTIDPGTVSAIGSGWTAPNAIAVDVAGATYVADSGTNTVYKTVPGAASTVVASGFNNPTAIAVDGASNVYVGDSGTNSVIEVPFASGVYGAKTTLLTGLSGATGLTVDAMGNVYVADSGRGRVLLLASSGNQGAGSIVSTMASGFAKPVAVAIDAAENLYVSDSGAGKVIQLAIPTSMQTTVLSGLTNAAGVAVDASGGLFAVDAGAKTITHLPSVNGSLSSAGELSLGTIVASPNAIAVDSAGDVYVADAADATVVSMSRTAGLVPFGRVNVGASSSTIAAIVSNAGTAALTFNSPYDSLTGNTDSFAIDASSTCASGATLNPGAACSIASVFSPTVSGALSETVNLSTTPTLNTTLTLTGTGEQLPKTTITVALVSPTSPSYGQAITVSATVAQVVAGGAAPTGYVTFYVDGTQQLPTVPLASLTIQTTLSGLSGGAHSITASYSGDDNYASSTSAALAITIGETATTTTVTIASSTVYADPTSQIPGVAVTFNAVVTPGLKGIPTGVVTFYSGTTALGAPVALTTAGTATLSTSSLAIGNYNVTATYSGDTNYSGSTSTMAQPLIISNPTISMTSSTTAVVGGGTAIALDVESIAGFGTVNSTTGSVDFSCSGLPKYAICAFNPAFAQVTPGVPATVAFSVLINQPPVIVVQSGIGAIPSLRRNWKLQGLIALIVLLPLVLLSFGLRGRDLRTGVRLFVLLLFAGCAVFFTGCGSSVNAPVSTPKGTSTITVSATIGTGAVNPPPAQTLTFQLSVQ